MSDLTAQGMGHRDHVLTVLGYDNLQRFLTVASGEWLRWCRRGVERSSISLEHALKKNLSRDATGSTSGPGETPILRRGPGGAPRLLQSVGITKSAGGLEAHIGASTFYIAIHEGGPLRNATREGDFVVIRAKRGLMKWRTPEGEFRAAAKVRIPVRRPVGRTWEEHGAEAFEEFWGTVRAELDRAGSGGGAGAVAL